MNHQKNQFLLLDKPRQKYTKKKLKNNKDKFIEMKKYWLNFMCQNKNYDWFVVKYINNK
jgi:hypothetical protein